MILWTTFEMALREPSPIPAILDFTRFLASSITFMVHLQDVSVYVDDLRLTRLRKNVGVASALTTPQGMTPVSPVGIMNVKSLGSTRKNSF